MRILHLSDLQIPPSPYSPCYETWGGWVKGKIAPAKVDFIVVCGSVTTDGQESSFIEAKEALKQLCNDLLPADKDSLRMHRLIVVPGKNDAPKNDMTQFDFFCQNLYYTENGHELTPRSETPSLWEGRIPMSSWGQFSQGIAFRQLKDVTVIGVPYWDVKKAAIKKNMLAQMQQSLARAEFPDPDFAKRRPILLVNSRSLLTDSTTTAHEHLNILGKACHDLGIELHLFGSGHATGLLPDPFFVKYIALGTGPRNASGFWPFRANLCLLSRICGLIPVPEAFPACDRAPFPWLLPHHIVACLIKGCIQAGVAPAEDKKLNLLPVDVAANLMVRLSLHDKALGLTFQIVNPQFTSLRDLIGWLVEEGYPLAVCSYEEWRQSLHNISSENAMKPFLSLLDEGPLFTDRTFSFSKVKSILGGDFGCPPFDKSLLVQSLQHMVKAGFLSPPHSLYQS